MNDSWILSEGIYKIAQRLKETARGRGDTILYKNHTWTKRAKGAGTVEEIPESRIFDEKRVGEMFQLFG
jgi:hypothetical protein